MDWLIDVHLTIQEIFFLYLCSGFILYLIELPQLVKSILALPGIVIVPLLVGKSIEDTMRWFVVKRNRDVITLSYYVRNWFLGAYFMGCVGVVLQLSRLTIILKNVYLLFIVIILTDLVYDRLTSLRNVCRHEEVMHRLISKLKKHSPLLLVCSFSIIPFLVKLPSLSPPLTVSGGWMDPVIQTQPSYRLLEKGFMDLSMRWPDYYFLAMTYPIFNVDPLFLSWSGTLLLTIIYSAGLYLMIYKLSNDVLLSTLTGITGIFLNAPTGLGGIVYHFKTNSMLYAMYPWVLLLVYEDQKDRGCKIKAVLKTLSMAVFLFTTLVFFSHIITKVAGSLGWEYETACYVIRPLTVMSFPLIGLFLSFRPGDFCVNVPLLFTILAVTYSFHEHCSLLYVSGIFVFIFSLQLVKEKWGKNIAMFFSFFVFLFILLRWAGPLENLRFPISNLLLSPADNSLPDFQFKRIVFHSGNQKIFRFLTLLGGVLLFFSQGFNDLLALSMLSWSFLVFYFPDFWTVRGLGLLTPFMAFSISKAILPISGTLKKIADGSTAKTVRVRVFSGLCVFLIIIVLMPSLMQPLFNRFSITPCSCLADYEYDAAVWLRENTKETEVILSDYWTMMLLNPISNKIWLTSRQMYATVSTRTQMRLLYIKNDVFNASDSKAAYGNILIYSKHFDLDWTEKCYADYAGIDPEKLTFLVIVSSRTVKWLEQNVPDVKYPQYSSVPLKYLKMFNDAQYFQLIYTVDERIYIYKVKS